jgi:hypothetical protein
VPVELVALQARQERIERQYQHDECQHILRRLDSYKEMACTQGRSDLEKCKAPTWEYITDMVNHDFSPRCLAGGRYFIGKFEESPYCSVHGLLVGWKPSP